MPLDSFTNFADTILIEGIDSSATTFEVPPGHGARFPSKGAFHVTVWNTSDFAGPKTAVRASPAQAEVMRVTRSGDVFTVVARGQGNTTAVNLNALGKVYAVSQNWTADDIASIGRDLSEVVTQASHGFTTLQVVRKHSDGNWVLAQATAGNASWDGVVVEILDTNTVRIVRTGLLTASGLTYGQYFLSAATAGLLTQTTPAAGTLYVPVMFATSETQAVVGRTVPAGEAASKHNGSHTGVTSVALLSPAITSLGTKANTETIAITNATSDFEVTLTGTANPITLPSTPPGNRRTLTVTFTSNSAKTLSIPSLLRLDSPSLGAVTSIAFGASVTRAVLVFFAAAETFYAVAAIGDEPLIPSSMLAGLRTDGTNASPTNDTWLSSLAYQTHLTTVLDALTLPYTDVVGFPANSIAGRGTGDGALLPLAIGAGLQVTTPSGVPTLSVTGGSGASTPVDITGSEIDWNAGIVRSKTISSSITFTTANPASGVAVTLYLTASGADRTPSWAANIDFGDQTPPTIVSGKSCLISLRPFGSYVSATVINNGFEFDTTAPTYTSTAIASDGNTFTDTYSEALHATITTTTGRTMTVNGVNITGTSPSVSGSTVVWTASPRIPSGTVAANAYTAPGTGIKDLAGNYAESYTGRQADVANSSTYSTYLFSQDTEGGSGSAQTNASSLNGTTAWNKSTAGIFATAGTYCWEYDGALQVDVGSAQNTLAFFFHFRAKENNATWIYLRNGAGTDQATLEFRLDRINVYHGGVLSAKVTTTTPDAECVIWGVYTANTGGNNGTFTLYYRDNSSDESRPGELGSTLTTGAGGAVQRIVFASPVAGNYYVGKLRLADSVIGSSPA